MVVAGVAKTIAEYIHQPVATKMAVAPMTTFPSTMVCTPYWVNETRARDLGMKKEDLKHLGRLTFIPQAFAWFVSGSDDDLQEFNLTMGSFLQKFGDHVLDDLFREISLDFTEASIPKSEAQSYPFFNQSLVLTEARGPCTRLESSLKLIPIMGSEEKVYLRLEPPKYAFGVEAQGEKPVPELFIGSDALSSYPRGSTEVGYGKRTAVQIKPTRLRLHPKRAGSCGEGIEYSEFVACAVDVVFQFCQKYDRGIAYTVGRNLTVRILLSKRFKRDLQCDAFGQNNEEKTMTDELVSKCPQPCDHWVYQVGATTIGETDDSTTSISLRIAESQNCLSFEEFFPTTLEGFVSNLGGQISLYTGASVVTMVHVFIFCFFTKR